MKFEAASVNSPGNTSSSYLVSMSDPYPGITQWFTEKNHSEHASRSEFIDQRNTDCCGNPVGNCLITFYPEEAQRQWMKTVICRPVWTEHSLSGSTLFSTSGVLVVSVDSVNAAPRCSIVLYLLTFLHFFFCLFVFLDSSWAQSFVDSGLRTATPHSDFCFPILFFFIFLCFFFWLFLFRPDWHLKLQTGYRHLQTREARTAQWLRAGLWPKGRWLDTLPGKSGGRVTTLCGGG